MTKQEQIGLSSIADVHELQNPDQKKALSKAFCLYYSIVAGDLAQQTLSALSGNSSGTPPPMGNSISKSHVLDTIGKNQFFALLAQTPMRLAVTNHRLSITEPDVITRLRQAASCFIPPQQ